MALGNSDKVGEAYVELRADFRKLNKDMLKLKAESKTTTQKVGSNFKSMFATIAIGGAAFFAIRSGIKKTIKSLKDLDTGLRNVNSIINVGEKELKGYKKELLNIQATLGSPTKDLTGAMYQLVSAGVAAKDSIAILTIATKAGIAGLASTEVAVDGITTVMNSWKLETKDATKVADIMFQTVKLGKTTFEELSASISQVAPLAASANISFEQVSGALATLTKSGVPTSVAVTQIRAAILSLQKVLGESVFEQNSLTEAMNIGVTAYKKSGKTMLEFFGRAEAVLGILSLTGQNARTAAEDFDAMTKSSGAMTTAFEEQSKSIEFKIKLLDGAMTSLSTTLVDTFAESITSLVTNFTGGLNIITGKALEARNKLIEDSITNEDVRDAWKKTFETLDTKGLEDKLKSLTGEWENLDELLKRSEAGFEIQFSLGEAFEGKNIKDTQKKLREDLLRLQVQAETINLLLSPEVAGKMIVPTKDIDDVTVAALGLREELEKLLEIDPLTQTLDKAVETKKRINALTQEIERLESMIERVATAGDKVTDPIGIEEGLPERKIDEELEKTGDNFKNTVVESATSFNDKLVSGGMMLGSLIARQLGLAADSFIGKIMSGLNMAFQVLSIIANISGAGTIGALFSGTTAQFGGSFSASNNGITKMANGGSGTVPLGFPNDSFPMLVTSREEVDVRTPTQSREMQKTLSNLISTVEGVSMNIMDLEMSPIIVNTIDADSLTEDAIKPAENKLRNENVKLDEL